MQWYMPHAYLLITLTILHNPLDKVSFFNWHNHCYYRSGTSTETSGD